MKSFLEDYLDHLHEASKVNCSLLGQQQRTHRMVGRGRVLAALIMACGFLAIVMTKNLLTKEPTQQNLNIASTGAGVAGGGEGAETEVKPGVGSETLRAEGAETEVTAEVNSKTDKQAEAETEAAALLSQPTSSMAFTHSESKIY